MRNLAPEVVLVCALRLIVVESLALNLWFPVLWRHAGRQGAGLSIWRRAIRDETGGPNIALNKNACACRNYLH